MIFKCYACHRGINIMADKYVMWRPASESGNTNQRTIEDVDNDLAFLRWHESCYRIQ